MHDAPVDAASRRRRRRTASESARPSRRLFAPSDLPALRRGRARRDRARARATPMPACLCRFRARRRRWRWRWPAIRATEESTRACAGGVARCSKRSATSPPSARGRSGLTDCLNFGNPRKLEQYSELVAAVDGLGPRRANWACRSSRATSSSTTNRKPASPCRRRRSSRASAPFPTSATS